MGLDWSEKTGCDGDVSTHSVSCCRESGFLAKQMSLFVCRARSFNSFVNVLKTLAFPHVLLIFAHLLQSLQFISNHWEIAELAGHDNAPLALVFAVLDVSLVLATVASVIMKANLSHNQYLTDSQNNLYRVVIIFSAICSCVFAFLTYDATLRDEATAETFEKSMLLAMALYPTGPKKRLIDRIQIKYHCCGANCPTEWFSLDWYGRKSNWTQDDAPFSCCSNALQIPCIHLNMKKHTYYVKYNSTTPTIWTDGCVTKFKEVYLVEFDWLLYFGMLVSSLSFVLALLDKTVQTADNTFAQNGRFRLGFWSREPQWEGLIEHHNRLAQERKPTCFKIRSSKPKSVWNNMSEVVCTIGKCKKQRNAHKSSLSSTSKSNTDCKCARMHPRPRSATSSLQSTVCEATSASSSGSSARKRKLAYFLPSSCVKKTKKNV